MYLILSVVLCGCEKLIVWREGKNRVSLVVGMLRMSACWGECLHAGENVCILGRISAFWGECLHAGENVCILRRVSACWGECLHFGERKQHADGENCMMRSFVMDTRRQGEVSRTCSTYGGYEKYVRILVQVKGKGCLEEVRCEMISLGLRLGEVWLVGK
jgi:hypothetical protein